MTNIAARSLLMDETLNRRGITSRKHVQYCDNVLSIDTLDLGLVVEVSDKEIVNLTRELVEYKRSYCNHQPYDN